jgi:hypothetical protein
MSLLDVQNIKARLVEQPGFSSGLFGNLCRLISGNFGIGCSALNLIQAGIYDPRPAWVALDRKFGIAVYSTWSTASLPGSCTALLHFD